MVGLLCKVKSQGSFLWVLYASPLLYTANGGRDCAINRTYMI